ncbi:MAG TPA: helix-turn-helix transcriptional regulator [Acholeplasmataceae bacterium]|nr:helix-turn-helix transcriptional regulator [Acholeplasmataceae bacterium]
MKKMFESELRRRRKVLKISQIELARMVGVSLMTIQMWERGATTPKPENEEKLERVLSTLEKEMGK